MKKILQNRSFISKYFKKPLKVFVKMKTRSKLLLFTTLFALLFLILPNIGGALKVLGFIEPDFIKSTSGAIYETNPVAFPYFLFKVGASEDKANPAVELVASGKTFKIKQLTSSGEVKVEPDPQGVIENEPVLEGIDTSPFEKIENSLASISAELAEVEQKVSETSLETLSVLGESEQRLFGPYEQILFRRTDGNGEYSYHREGVKIIETLNFVAIPEKLDLQVELPSDTRMVLSSNGVASLVSDGVVVASFKLMFSTDGSSYGDFVTAEGNYSGSSTLSFPLTDLAGKSGAIRIIYSADSTNITEIEKLGISKEYVQFSTSVAPEPKYLTQYKGETLFYSEVGTSMSIIRSQAMTTLFSFPESVLGVSCSTDDCFAISKSGLYQFNPDEALKSMESDVQIAYAPTFFEVSDSVSGGLGSSSEYFYRTSSVSPGGSVYEFAAENLNGVKILSDLSTPTLISSNSNATRVVLWSDGKLLVGSSSGEFESVQIDHTPTSLAVDDFGFIYLALSPSGSERSVVVRLNPESGDSHVLAKFVGDISSIMVDSQHLSVGLSVSNSVGAIVKLPLDSAKWIPVVTSLPSL
jgi:hypothetical protein